MQNKQFPDMIIIPNEPGKDYSQWGNHVNHVSLLDATDDALAGLGAQCRDRSDKEFAISAATTHDYKGKPQSVYDAGTGHYKHGVFTVQNAMMFFANGAVMLPEHETLIAESTWQSQTHTHPNFRAGPSTKHRWRTDLDLSDLSFDGQGDAINCYHRFNHQYFHWFIDCLPRVWLLQKGDYPDLPIIVGDLAPGSPQMKSLHALGLEMDDLYFPKSRVVQFSSLICPYSKLKESLHVRPSFGNGEHYKGGWDPYYLLWLNDLMRGLFANTPVETGKRVYADRSGANHRRLKNATRFHAFLRDNGFSFVDPGAHSFEEQVAIFNNAELVVGPHGAGLSNIMWCNPQNDISVVEVGIQGVFDTGYTFISSALGFEHDVLFGEPLAHRHGAAFADLDEDEDKLIELVRQKL